MLISTRGRYAIRVMTDMLENEAEAEYIPLKEISGRLDISLKYLESIMSMLSKGGLVSAASGKGGGYRLVKKGNEYSLGEILQLTEGNLDPVSCTGVGDMKCENGSGCHTRPIWEGLSKVINGYLSNVTLEDLVEDNVPEIELVRK